MHVTALDDAAWASPWRRVRVGEKLWLSLGLVVSALVVPVWPGSLLIATIAVAAALGPARIPARVMAAAFAVPGLFIVIGALSVAVRVGPPSADAWLAWWLLSVDAASLTQAATVAGRACAGTLGMLLLATTTPMIDLLTWLRRCRVPGPLIETASLMYRLLFVLLETVFAVADAQKARLGDAPLGAGRFRRRLANASAGIGAVMLRTWDRAVRLQHGLEARGLEGELRMLAPVRAGSRVFVMVATACLVAVWAVAVVVR